jgi:hypothetical protein
MTTEDFDNPEMRTGRINVGESPANDEAGSAYVTKENRNKRLCATLSRLKQEHRDLDTAIQSLESSLQADPLQLKRLKKKKLQLKDEIARTEDELLPDIIA